MTHNPISTNGPINDSVRFMPKIEEQTMEDMKNTNEVQTTTTPQATFTHKIGNTTYVVGVHFSKTSKETI